MRVARTAVKLTNVVWVVEPIVEPTVAIRRVAKLRVENGIAAVHA